MCVCCMFIGMTMHWTWLSVVFVSALRYLSYENGHNEMFRCAQTHTHMTTLVTKQTSIDIKRVFGLLRIWVPAWKEEKEIRQILGV